MNKLEACIEVYKKLTNKTISQRVASGNLPAADYPQLKQRLDDLDLLRSSNDDDHFVKINLSAETNQLFAFDIDDLLITPLRQLKAPTSFYVADLDYLYKENEDSEPPKLINQYLDTVKLASALISIADHTVKGHLPKAIFLLGEKLELSLKYGKEDLQPLVGLDKFITDFINADIHKEQKAAIIKKVLLDMLSNNEIDRLTLPCLIRRFEEFIDRVSANYQLYVSEFSFEKIKAQVEQEKFDLTLKLNKVLSDIQNQLLAVPIALIVAGSQMSSGEGFTAKNIFVLISSMVFGAFMHLLIKNQRNTLQAIETEVAFQWDLIKNKHSSAQDRFKQSYDKLETRCSTQYSVLSFVQGVVILSIILVTLLFLYFSGCVDQASLSLTLPDRLEHLFEPN